MIRQKAAGQECVPAMVDGQVRQGRVAAAGDKEDQPGSVTERKWCRFIFRVTNPADFAEAVRAPSRAKSSHGLIPICTCGGETAPKEVRFANCRVHPFHAFEDL